MPISTARLEPTAAELLKYIEAAVAQHGYRPAELAVDTQSAVAGVRCVVVPVCNSGHQPVLVGWSWCP